MMGKKRSTTKRKRSDSGANDESDNESLPPTQPRVTDTKVVLDVGGTRFVAAKSTLTSSSTYFEALFSARWQDDRSAQGQPVFIDQRPDAFEFLLDYMRCGAINLPRNDENLCNLVLRQAQFLGINELLTSVKATAYKRIHRREDFGKNEVADAKEFDDKYGSLHEVILAGILPTCFFPPIETLAIRVHDKVFRAQKKILIGGSSYFRKELQTNPLDYWKEQIVLCGHEDVVELVLQWICSGTIDETSLWAKTIKDASTKAGGTSACKLLVRDIMQYGTRFGVEDPYEERAALEQHGSD